MNPLLLQVEQRVRASGVQVERISLEVEVEGRRELVVVSLTPNRVSAVASDGSTEGPHVDAALRLLGGGSFTTERGPNEMAREGARTIEPRESLRAPARPEASPHAEVASALDDLATAIVRSGTLEASSSPAVEEAFEQVLLAAGRPTPPGLSRAIGRLRQALLENDPEGVVRILEGVIRLVQYIEEPRGPEAKRCIRAWLQRPGESQKPKTLSDRRLIEVGREWLAGATRHAIQRRYLVCTATGAVYCEEQSRGVKASDGPCPRALSVGLAELQAGPDPFRIRLLQYEVSPRVEPEMLERIEEFALTRFAGLRDQYRSWSKSFPALAEPFVVLAPEAFEYRRQAGRRVLVAADRGGDLVVLEAESGGIERFESLRAGSRVRWIAGRVSGVAGNIVLALHSACFEDESGRVFERLR